MASKTCSKCKQEKPLSDFHKDRSGHSPDGLKYHCRACAIAYTNAWKQNNPTSQKASSQRTKRKLKYGLTERQIAAMLVQQQFRCRICGEPISFDASTKSQKPHIDHDHVSGVVRGLLCLTCNTGLGMFKDSVTLLHEAANYLQTFGQRERLSEVAPSRFEG